MTDQREDIPDLPRMHYWFECTIQTAWGPMPMMDVRKRGLFRTKIIARQAMQQLPHAATEQERNQIRETAQRRIAQRMKL